VAGATSNPETRAAGEQLGQGCHEGSAAQFTRPGRASLEYSELVAQDQDLDLLRPLGSGERIIQPRNLESIRSINCKTTADHAVYRQ
jgi:hypothetical protein